MYCLELNCAERDSQQLGLSDVAQGIDIICLAETWSINIRRIGITCIYYERLDNYILLYKYEDYK